MSATIAMPTTRPRVVMVGLIATCAAVLGWLATGLAAAIPAGLALTVLAATDLSTHRFSLRMLSAASVLVALALAADAATRSSSNRLAVALVGTVGIGLALGLAWLCSGGIALGDVLLVAFTVAVPLYVSTQAAVVALATTLVVAGGAVLAHAAWQGGRRRRTFALAPALLVGWVFGVVVG